MTKPQPADPDRYRRGHDDGYRVGPDGIDPTGDRVTVGYDPDLFGDPDYQRGLSEGRAKRIDDDWATTHSPATDPASWQPWPWATTTE